MHSYRRVLLKISGEAFMGNLSFGIAQDATALVASRLRTLYEKKIQVGVVVGGGNICRSVQQGAEWGLERTPGDQIGILSTIINGIVLNQALQKIGCKTRMVTAFDCPAVAEKFQWERAMRYLDDGYIVLFVGGTGHPYFTTDTTAALRACEMRADILLKATTRVDGIYDKDPRKEKGAIKYQTLSFQELLEKRLKILDLSAVTMCMEANIPIRVFNFFQGSLLDALSDKPFGSLVTHVKGEN